MKKIEIKEKISLSKLKEMWKDKRGRAKIELSAYLIFFLIVVVFARVSSSTVKKSNINQDNSISFINEINDNYEYNMNITINNDNYNYKVKVLGNNSSIVYTSNDDIKMYYTMNNKYYELDDNGNYILTTPLEIYPFINYNYLNISNIKNFIKYSIKENNTYKIKVSEIILNNNSNDEIIINVDEENKSIDIDYTNILKIDNNDIDNANVKITFSNINSILSLEE